MGQKMDKARRILNSPGKHKGTVPLKVDTLEIARRAREDQGSFETEISFGGEADLHRLRKRCAKNPGHTAFIPINKFNIEHLPASYRDRDLVEWIKTWADRTVRLSVRYISDHRPEYFPNTDKPFPFHAYRGTRALMTGTGYVSEVIKYTDGDNKICECEECQEGITPPKSTWAEVVLGTACHVVYDALEAQETSCYLFYDDKDKQLRQHPFFNKLRVLGRYVEQDRMVMIVATHDMDLVNKLDQSTARFRELAAKVCDKYQDYRDEEQSLTELARDSDFEPLKNLSICVSHPHGCSKQVSIGVWSGKQKTSFGRCHFRDKVRFDGVLTKYTYNTPTCRGSSGARVFSPAGRLLSGGKMWDGLHHAHSEGSMGNINISSLEWEPV